MPSLTRVLEMVGAAGEACCAHTGGKKVVCRALMPRQGAPVSSTWFRALLSFNAAVWPCSQALLGVEGVAGRGTLRDPPVGKLSLFQRQGVHVSLRQMLDPCVRGVLCGLTPELALQAQGHF